MTLNGLGLTGGSPGNGKDPPPDPGGGPDGGRNLRWKPVGACPLVYVPPVLVPFEPGWK